MKAESPRESSVAWCCSSITQYFPKINIPEPPKPPEPPPATEPERPVGPEFATLSEIGSPVNLSHNPEGFRGWAGPKIYIYKGKLVVTYLGVVNGRTARWLIEYDGSNWSRPREMLNGTPVIKNDKVYMLSPVRYVEKSEDLIGGGAAGVVINMVDDDFKVTKSITVDKTPTSNDVDQNPKSAGVIDSQGNLHVIWERDTKTATDIYYTKFNGKNFSEPVSVSNSPEIGSVNPTVAVDGRDIIYVFWGEFSEGMYVGDVDIYYSFLEDGVWSEPKNINNAEDSMEYMAIPFGNDMGVHAFYMAILKTEPGPTSHLIIDRDEIIRDQKINFGFGDIDLVFEGDGVHAVYGGAGPVEGGGEMTAKGYVYYNYYDGEEWGAGKGVDILPKEFVDNAELWKIDVSSIGSDQQAKIILENGEKDLLREIHLDAVMKDGLIYAVFEYNQYGTYDAYLVTLKK